MSISSVISLMVARKAPQGVSLFSRRGESICVKGFFFRVEFWICLKDFFIKWMISHSRRNIQLFALFHSCPCTCRSRLPTTKEFSAKNLSFLKISSLFLGNLYFFIYFCRKKSYSGFKNSTWELLTMESSENGASLSRDPVWLKELLAVLGQEIYAVFFQLQSKLETSLIIPTVAFLRQPRHEGQKEKVSSGLHIKQAFKSSAPPSAEVCDKGELLFRDKTSSSHMGKSWLIPITSLLSDMLEVRAGCHLLRKVLKDA